MKIKNALVLATSGVGYDSLSKEMQDKLIGKTLNQAIAEGLVTELGDDDGNLFAEGATVGNYAIINGCRVTLSGKLVETDPEEVNNMLGDLTFGGGISNVEGEGKGKYWFNIGLPRKVMLTASNAVNIKAMVGA